MNRSIRGTQCEDGVSETIAVVLLIGLTVVGIALIGVFLFSQPMAEEVPTVDVLVSNDDSTILFQHNGGDSLNQEDFTIFVNETAVDPADLNIISPGDWPWSVGEIIQYTATGNITPLNENVRIAYREDKGILLRPAFVDDAGTAADLADVSSAPLPTLLPGVVPSDPAEAGEIVAESILSDSNIIVAFSSLEKTAILEGRFLNFTIVSPNSTINIPEDPSVGSLSPGDTVSIMTVEDQAARNRITITAVGKTFFVMRFEKAKVWINGNPVLNHPKDEVQIKSAWIPKYTDLESTLAFRLDPVYELYIDGVLDPRGDSVVLTLENVRPTESGMFIINAWSPDDNENSVVLANADGI